MTFPKVTPNLDGSMYCVPCVWNGRHPRRADNRIYVVRFSDNPMDRQSMCHEHLADSGYLNDSEISKEIS